MMFHTTAFILGFLPVFLAGYFTIGQAGEARLALYWLTACSLLFYAWWNPLQLPLLVGSVALNYAIAWKLRNSCRPHAWLKAGIALNLATLGWFKYADFFLHIVAPNAPALNISLPLAISFFTFQQIMFLVDTSHGPIRLPTERNRRLDPPEGNWRQNKTALLAGARRPTASALFRSVVRWPLMLCKPFEAAPTGYSAAIELNGGHRATHGMKIAHWAATGCSGDSTFLRPRSLYYSGSLETKSGRRQPDNQATILPAEHAATASPLPRLLPYAAFVTFFPHLIAGPIVRPSEIIPQLTDASLARPCIANIADGLLIFLLGFGKKLVLADMFGGFADTGFDAAAHGVSLTFFEAWYATLSYALQIYFDFSGYSDMAIGLARMLNVHFPLNFDSPYQATDIAAFWRRWHITLGGFLRDYVYIPLGGNRAGTLRRTGNLMLTMLLAGLWHGAAWNFVIWGGLHGVFLVAHAQYRRLFRPLPHVVGHALTLCAVILAWVPFRAASLSCTMAMLTGMAGLNGITLPRMIVSAFPPLAAIAAPVSVMRSLGDARTLSFPEVSACLLLGWLIVLTLPNIHRMSDRARQWTLTGSFALSVQALFFAPHIAPFLYFQF